MSSLAASRADNFYFPPEWRPEMGGISKFQGSKGANQYEQYGIIRFELPFDAWCLGCSRHMSKGLRFNAKKDKAGKYFSTQIYSFSMKCYSCEQRFKILTDPENGTYNFAEGLRKHEQDFEPEVNDSIINPVTEEVRRQISSDPMFKLQHDNEDIRKINSEKERFEFLSDIRDSLYKNDYNMNSILRKANRARKKKEKDALDEGEKRGIAIPLLEANDADKSAASLISYRKGKLDQFKTAEKEKLIQLQSSSLFGVNEDKGSKRIDMVAYPDVNSNSSRSKVEKRKLVETAMMKQARVKINPAHFKLSSQIPKEDKVLVKADLQIKKKTMPDTAEEGNESSSFPNALSMLAKY